MVEPDPAAELTARLHSDAAFMARGGREIWVAGAPGRLDLLGGIADFTGSTVCEMTMQPGAAVAVQRRDDRKLMIKRYGNGGLGGAEIALSLDDYYGTAALLPIQTLQGMFKGEKHWAGAVGGAYPVLAKHKKITRRTMGANISIHAGMGAGSSTSVACATLFAITAAYHLILEPMEVAILAHKIDSLMGNEESGLADAVASVFGKKDQMVMIQCQPHEVKGFVRVPEGMLLCGVQLKGESEGNREAVTRAKAAAFMAQTMLTQFYADMGMKKDPTKGYLANVPPATYEKYFQRILPERMRGEEFLKEHGNPEERGVRVEPGVEYQVQSAAEHHILVRGRVERFAGCMQAMNETTDNRQRRSQAVVAGKVLQESHESLVKLGFGGAETELAELIRGLGKGEGKSGIYGAKITGARMVAVLLDNSKAARMELQGAVEEFEKQSGRRGEILSESASGAGEAGAVRVSPE